MEAFLVSITTVAVAEMGDRTQLLSLVLAAHYRKPWPILAGVFLATLGNHALAGLAGVWFGGLLSSAALDAVVGGGMLAMSLWMLKPDTLVDGAAVIRRGAFLATPLPSSSRRSATRRKLQPLLSRQATQTSAPSLRERRPAC